MDKTDDTALVGIVPRKYLWDVIQNKRWYHIPVKSAPRNSLKNRYIGFYFPKAFSDKLRYQVIYYAPVININRVQRIDLFPDEVSHPRKHENYYKFNLGDIQKLPRPIPSKRWRRIVHIPTNLRKLLNAEEINDLYDTSPLKDKMYKALKKIKIYPERQIYVNLNSCVYCLDFCIFCIKSNIDLECDGERYHSLPDALKKDTLRNNQLTSFGWHVLRFSGREIHKELKSCLDLVKQTVNVLDGLKHV